MSTSELQARLETALNTIADDLELNLSQVLVFTVRFGLNVLSLCTSPEELDEFCRNACQEGRAIQPEFEMLRQQSEADPSSVRS